MRNVSHGLDSEFQQFPRWASNSSAFSGGNEQKTRLPHCLNEEKGLDLADTAISQSFRSLLYLSQSSAPIKQPLSSYPRVFCNPVSDRENHEPDHSQEDSSTNPDSSYMMSTRNNQRSPAEEASPNSSYSIETLVDVERDNETEIDSTKHYRCGVCKKLLSQRSPWYSYKIMRRGDMPAAGVFPCHHVYHVECLEATTPTAQTRDPLCPVCPNTIGETEQPLIVPETLQLALRSLRRSRTALESETLSNSCNDNQRRQIRRRSHKWVKLS